MRKKGAEPFAAPPPFCVAGPEWLGPDASFSNLQPDIVHIETVGFVRIDQEEHESFDRFQIQQTSGAGGPEAVQWDAETVAAGH